VKSLVLFGATGRLRCSMLHEFALATVTIITMTLLIPVAAFNVPPLVTLIANGHPATCIDDLMPWAFQKPSI
jgi:hypothetical protein